MAEVAADSSGVLWFAASNGAWNWNGSVWRHYTTSDGLADNAITCLAVDRTGAKWFGTMKGVTRFDGNSWRTFTMKDGLPNDRVNTAAVDSSGNVWFGTDFGAARWDGSQMKYFLKGSVDKLLENRVTDIALDSEGRLWFCHGIRGLTMYDGVQWKRLTTAATSFPEPDLKSMACQRSGVFWFVLGDGDVASFDGMNWVVYGNDTFHERVKRVFVDQADRVWFVKDYSGLVCFDGTAWTGFYQWNGLRSDQVTAVGTSLDGTIYACTSRGVSRFNGTGWQNVPDPERPVSWNVRDMAEAPDGAMWFATDDGLTRFDGSGWRTWTMGDGLPGNIVTAVAAGPDESIWCVAGGKLCRFDGSSITVYPGPVEGEWMVGESYFQGPIAVDEKGTVWACSNRKPPTGGKGLWSFHDGVWESFMPGFGEEGYVAGVYPDRRGVIWYATSPGLASWDGRERNLHRVNSPDHVGAAQIVTDRDGVVWVTSANVAAVTYAALYDGRTWKVFAPGTVPEIASTKIQIDTAGRKWFPGAVYLEGDSLRVVIPHTELPDHRLGFVVEGDGSTLWFGSESNGLFRWNNGVWTNYTTADGLPSNTIIPLAVGPDGILWCSSGVSDGNQAGGHGIAWFDGSVWREYEIEGGANTVVFGKNGESWFGTWSGVLRFVGGQWTEFREIPGVKYPSVTSLAVDDNGNLWASDWKGALRFDGQEWKLYTTADGLLSNNVGAVGVDSRNRKWFATRNGYCVLDDTAPQSVSDSAPAPFALLGNHPNPFNPSTTISFTLPQPGKATLTVYDVTGRKVRTLISGNLPAGAHSAVWDGKDERGKTVSSGMYLSRLESGKVSHTVKMLLMK